MIFPKIKEPGMNGSVKIEKPCVAEISGDVERVAEKQLKKKNVSFSENGNVFIICKKEYFENKEAYSIDVSEDGKIKITLGYNDEISLWHAVNTLIKMLENGDLPLGRTVDYPSFEIRGYIEGFYGKPWQKNQRKDMMEFLSENHINTYFYAPKDDLYHREKWDKLYPEKELCELTEIVKTAKENHISFHYCV